MGKMVGTEDTLLEILQRTKEIREFTEIIAGKTEPGTWAYFKHLVNADLAQTRYPVGTQIADKWAKNDATVYDILWDVVHYNGGAYLNWHYAYPDGVMFDAPEAIYYAPEEGLPAGSYYITVGSAYGDGWKVGQHISFTLTNDMEAGDQLFIDFGSNYANDPTAGRAWRVYAKGDATVKQSGTTSDGTSGTELGTIGNANAQKTNGNLNAISRAVYGSARWSESAVRQWLNSAAGVGEWWEPKNPWDRPPTQLTSLRGFLAGFSQEFLDILEETEVVTALNTVEEFQETTEVTYDKIFLPSLQEMYANVQLANVEGVDWDYNKTLAAEAGFTGRFPWYQDIPVLKKYNLSSTASPVHVWLRSCYRGSAGTAWYVNSSGYVNLNGSAVSAFRGCPACKIKKREE